MIKVFLKKELKEVYKTPKIIIIFAVFLFFGFLSPITAKYINEILGATGGLEGISLPEPTYYDSFVQFFKNSNSIYILVMVFSYMGCVINEKKSGTIILMLSKGLSRRSFVIAKFLSAAIYFTVAYVSSAVVTYVYTYLLFGKFDNQSVWTSIGLFWIFGIFIIALTVFASTISKSISTSALISVGGNMILALLTIIKPIRKFNPVLINSLTINLITGVNNFEDVIVTVVSTLLLTCILLIGSVYIFEKQEI